MTKSGTFDAKKFNAILSSVTKKYNNNPHIAITGTQEFPVSNVMPIGDLILDRLLAGEAGVGGIPIMGITEISGPESSGKTTLSLEYVSVFLKAFPDKAVVFIDVEHSLDARYAEHIIGADFRTDRFIWSRPETGIQAVSLAKDLAISGMVSCIVIDSWAALSTPSSDKKDEVGADQMGAHALLSSNALKELSKIRTMHGVTFILLNQQRVNITKMGAFGKKTTGGEAIKFYPQMRLTINPVAGSKDGQRLVTVIKSKTQAIPYTNAQIYIRHNYGLDRVTSLVTYAMESKIITKSGNWYEFTCPVDGLTVKSNGLSNFINDLNEDADVLTALCNAAGVPVISPRGILRRSVLGTDKTVDEIDIEEDEGIIDVEAE